MPQTPTTPTPSPLVTLIGGTTGPSNGFFSPALMNLIRDPNNQSRAKIVWGQGTQPGTVTSPYTPMPMTPVAPTVPGIANPAPLTNPTTMPDWTGLVTALINRLTAPPAPQPVTVTPPNYPPQTQTDSPSHPSDPATVTDIMGGDDGSTQTQKSKQGGGSETIDNPTPAQKDAMVPAHIVDPDVSQLSKLGLTASSPPTLTGGPLIIPSGFVDDGAPLTSNAGLAPNRNRTPDTIVNDHPSADDIAAMQPAHIDNGTGGVSGPGPSPVTVTPSALGTGGFSGGPAVVPNDFGDASSGKTGSDGGVNINDLINGAINVGGIFAPAGAGLAAGLAKGLYQGFTSGDTSNTNGLTDAQSLLYGPSLGERIGSYISGLFSSGGMPISAANDPNAQITNEGAGLFSGNPYGFTGMSGGMFSSLNPSMNFSTQQLGSMLDLSGLSDIMSSAKMGMGGM